MITDTVAKKYMHRPYGYKRTGLVVLLLAFFLVRLSFAEYGQLKLDRNVTTPTGNDRLLIYLIGVSKDGLGYDFHSLVWEQRSSGVWKTHKTITRKDLEAYSKHRLWIEDVYSLEPETGYAILKIAEESPSKNSHEFNFTRSWRKWDVANNVEVQFLRECKDAMEPYVIDDKYRASIKQAKQRSVYIDVINDSDEYATKKEETKKPKDAAVQSISDNLIHQLEARKVVVFTQHNTEATSYVEERIFVARANSSKLYVALQSSYGKQDCVRIYTPSRDERYASLKKRKVSPDNEISRSLFDSIEKAKIDYIVASSTKLAEMLSSSITASAPSLCIQKQSKKSYILNNSDQPTILIDFTVVRKDEKLSYLHNTELEQIIVEALSTTIDDYLKSTVPANNN